MQQQQSRKINGRTFAAFKWNAYLVNPNIVGWYLPLTFLALWHLAFIQQWLDNTQWVAPSQVFIALFNLLASADFWWALGNSLWRFAAGLILGAGAGIIVGIMLARSLGFRRYCGPSFNLVRQISLFAWIPLLSVYLGYGDSAKITFIALACFYPVALNTCEGVGAIAPKLFEAASVYQLRGRRYWLGFILPAASQRIFTGVQLGVIYAWLGTIGAEFLLRRFGSAGISDTLINGRSAYLVDQIIVGTLVIGLTGFLLNRVVQIVEKRQQRWVREHH